MIQLGRGRNVVPLLLSLLLGWCVALSAAGAGTDTPESIVKRLGSPRFAERVVAEEILLKRATTGTVSPEWLRKRLETESNPETRLRLQRIVRTIGSSTPVEQVRFNQAALHAKSWSLLEPEQGRLAQYRIRGGVLDLDSTKVHAEGLTMVHRFELPVEEGQELLRFGPPPRRKLQRYVLDAEIKVIKENHDRPGLSGVHMNVEDHRPSAGLMILEDRVFTYRSKEMHLIDTTDRWHHYRFVIEGGTQKIYIDRMDVPVFELQRPQGVGRSWATFGDCTSAAGARTLVRNVTFLRYDLAPKAKEKKRGS